MPKFSHLQFIVLGSLFTLLVLALVACDPDNASDDTPTPNPTAQNTNSKNVFLRNFVFEPDEFNIPVGTVIEFKLKSKDIEHTFTVKDLAINWFVPSGTTVSKTFSFDQQGEYQLICAIAGHEQAGMVGIIVVQ
ncbi:cupredoxin domain-containing protein [Dehalococcoidia bacterium]|nr:cupredoxin domain-containing protein [Dehalococcoidia bacterium]